ncbi:MAG: SusC/RagA family TonB-linked outer membrane protein [Janthinobacterium lividum]
MLSGWAFAQTGSISGRIVDEKRLSLPGASVTVDGTTLGSTTDLDGNYKINGVKAGSVTLTAQFVGYNALKKTVTVNSSGTIVADFQMVSSAQSLNEVVVIGYGSERKKDLSGSIATVNSKDFQQGIVTTPEQLIAGKVAGVSITSNGGAPGAGSQIRIRGGASVNGSNDPLIVIDGVPLAPNHNPDGTPSISGVADPLSLINPNDIETFSVLKDASAAAIYGNRASNGVIIITTKKGKSGKPVINFSTQFSASKLPKEASVLSASQFRDYINANDTTTSGKYKALLGTANTDWQKQIYQTAYTSDNNLSISGSAGKLPYRVSVGYTNQDGILKTSSLERYTTAINLSPSLFTDHIKINFNVKGADVNQRFANESAISSAVDFNPTVPVYSGNSSLYGGYYEYTDASNTPSGLKALSPLNPLGLLMENNNTSKVYRVISSLALDYKLHFFPDLHANINISYDGSRGTGSQSVPGYAASNLDSYPSNGTFYSGYNHQYKQTNGNKLFEGFLSYNKEIKAINSRIDAVAGYSDQKFSTNNYNYSSYFADGTINPNSVPTYYNDIAEYELTSIYARVNYVYNNKYILTGTIRNDYSTRFAPGDRSGVFPSGAFAWRIHDEDFLKDNKTLSSLKLRLGYGVTGNQEGIGNYQYLSNYSQSTATARYQFGSTYYSLYRPGGYYPGRTWETTATSNAAFDFGFLDDRITGSVDYYYRKTKNLLALINQPALTNFTNQIVGNVGNMRDQGVEFNVNAQIIKSKDLNWTAGFNVTYNQNKITNLTLAGTGSSSGLLTGSISGGTGNTIQTNSVGYTKYSFYTYQQVYGANGKPLDGVFVDRNGDGIINQNDLYISKSPDPKEYFGFSTDLRYKNWSAGLVARANLGNYVYNNVASSTGVQRNFLNPIGILNNGSSTVLASGLIGSSDRQVLSDYWLENAAFLRMDNTHVGYNFGKVFQNSGNLTISFNVQNVFIITKYKGVDPEVANGIDNNFYPRPRTYVLGLNLAL